MEFYLDTADINAVKRLYPILPIKGVTTNPSIVAKEKKPLFEVLAQLQDVIGPEGQLFAQVIANNTSDMVKEAEKLTKQFPSLVVKVPVTVPGLAAIKILTAQGIPTLGTAVYGSAQGLLSALAGAKYVAPYVNRIDAQNGSGIDVVNELQTLLTLHAPSSMVLAASFRTPRQVLDCLLAGCEAITVPIDVAELLLADPAVDAAINKFESDWQQAFGSLTL